MSREAVYRLAREGYNPALRLRPRGRLLFDEEQVKAALHANRGRQSVPQDDPGGGGKRGG